jgi:hypothetical protein
MYCNLSDITSEFRFVAMFVTTDLETIFHSQYRAYICMVMAYI